MIFKRLHKDEKGSSLTEFTIGLPIFLLIFSGIVSIHQLSQASLVSMTTANKKLWENAQEHDIQHMSPITAAVGSAGDLAGLASGGSIKDLLNASQGGGIYLDSWAKNKAANYIPGATTPDSNHMKIGDIHKSFTDESPSQQLLDDNLLDPNVSKPTGAVGSILAGIASDLLEVSGAKMALATGIRYGTVDGASNAKTETTAFGDFTISAQELSLSRNTKPTHRLTSVGLVRLEHAANTQLDSILEIRKTPNKKGRPGWTEDDPEEKDVDQCKPMSREDFDKCLEETNEHLEQDWERDCADNADAFGFVKDSDKQDYINKNCGRENIPDSHLLQTSKNDLKEDAFSQCHKSRIKRDKECKKN